jgi:hypothetical protein
MVDRVGKDVQEVPAVVSLLVIEREQMRPVCEQQEVTLQPLEGSAARERCE